MRGSGANGGFQGTHLPKCDVASDVSCHGAVPERHEGLQKLYTDTHERHRHPRFFKMSENNVTLERPHMPTLTKTSLVPVFVMLTGDTCGYVCVHASLPLVLA